MTTLTVLFWTFFFIVFYSYVGYGLLVYFIVKSKRLFGHGRKKPVHISFEPAITLVVAAYNEEAFIRSKIDNTLLLDYPSDKLSIIFVTDGSSDRTPEIVGEYAGIRLYHQAARRGKVAAINRVMRFVTTPVVVFSDANTLLNRGCLKEIAKHYHDPAVGGVAGEKKILELSASRAAGAGEGIYWKYESLLKKLDSDLNTVVGAAGELFSIRTELFEETDERVLLDDFVISLKICARGYLIRYEPKAYAMEAPSAFMKEEQKRKIRISAGGFQSMVMLKELFNIYKYPLLSFQYISHRVLRWTLCPLCLLAMLVINLVLVINDADRAYNLLLCLQILFYAMAGVGWLYANNNIKIKLLYIPYYFLFMNVSLVIGFSRYVKNQQSVLWEKATRHTVS